MYKEQSILANDNRESKKGSEEKMETEEDTINIKLSKKRRIKFRLFIQI